MNISSNVWKIEFLKDRIDDYDINTQSSDLFSVSVLDCTRTFFPKNKKENFSALGLSFPKIKKKIPVQSRT